jgi:glucose-6-phosphate 1-dehydrogenase
MIEALPASHSDALVFLGATGDLAYREVFPALHSMAKRGHLKLPIIGVAKAGKASAMKWTPTSAYSATP